jgi:hypothetical protein
MNTRSKLRRTAVVAAAGATTLAVALPAFTGASAAKTRHSASKTVTLPAKSTKTIDVRYPQALKFKNARYSCAFKVTGLGRKNVKILSHGSALGGTVCRVKARNNAKLPSIDTTAKVKVTATTVY